MNRIKELREERNLSTRSLENLININYASISHYENGKRDISTDNLITLANFFNVSIDYLICNSDSGLYGVLENSNIIIEFNHDEYENFRKSNSELIEYIDNKRIIKLDKEMIINTYKKNIEKNADEITSIQYKYIK